MFTERKKKPAADHAAHASQAESADKPHHGPATPSPHTGPAKALPKKPSGAGTKRKSPPT
jgi:hypothetical protein